MANWQHLNRLILIVVMTISLSPHIVFGEGYPLRAKYSEVPYIEIDELYEQYNNVVIVDVRSDLEFRTVHISKAIWVSLSKPSFVDEIASVRRKNPGQRMVVYCNGHSCAKSYKAVKKILTANIDNVVAFDGGVFDWTNAHPDKTTLLGTNPVERSKIISNDRFQSVLKNYSYLFEMSLTNDVLVIDVRDKFQIDHTPAFNELKQIKLDVLLTKFMLGKYKNKKLIFIDAVGKQVRWLQYYLNEFGYSDYLFLRGGVASVPQ